MLSLLPLLALLPAALGAPAPQATQPAASQVDPAVYSSLSSSISSSLVKAMACTPKTSSTSSTRSTSSTTSRASSTSTARSASSTTSSRSSSTSSRSSSTSSRASSNSSRASSTSSRASATSLSSSRSSALPPSSVRSSTLTPSQSSSYWKPTLANTFLYDLDNIAIEAPTVTTNNGLKLTKDIYIIDMEGHSKEQIAAYKAQGKKVVCYISAGSWEPWRDDALSFDPACYCGKGEAYDAATGLCKTNKNKMDGWNEWWLDVRTPSCLANIQPIMSARIKAAKAKGCDGVDPDNVDSYANGVSYGTTDQDQVNYLVWWADQAHSNGMAIGLKNSGNLLSSWEGVATPFQASLVKAFDYSVIEECVAYKECHIYDSFLKAGKPEIRVEYENSVRTCPAKESGVTFSVYSSYTIDSKTITLDC